MKEYKVLRDTSCLCEYTLNEWNKNYKLNIISVTVSDIPTDNNIDVNIVTIVLTMTERKSKKNKRKIKKNKAV